MAFTGDLEHLPIVDIIQLVHTTRKSGVFSIRANNAESQIVFRNGSIVSANHIDNRVRIGSVLVKTGVITIDDLKQAMAVMKQSDKNRLPLLATLVQMGTLKREDAVRGLKKLVEMTIVELMSWTKGTFTFDTDAVIVSADGDQDLEVDAQMVLMDALRILDERERDRAAGKEVPSLEELYGDVVPEENSVEAKPGPSVLTAADLGLADLDRLEKKIPRPVSETETFDPAAIHRQKIKELLPGFSPEEQEAVLSFLRKSAGRRAAPGTAAKQAGKALVLFSNDALISHSVVSLCSDDGLLVFATDDDTELDGMVSRCLLSARMPVVVFDRPAKSEGRFSRESIAGLRNQISKKYSSVPVIQFVSPQQTEFILQSYADGVRAVFPKPSREDRRETFIRDVIQFLDAFRTSVRNFQYGQDDADIYGRKLKDCTLSLTRITTPSDVALVVLTAVSDMFERAVTLVVRGSELIGERAIGISSEKSLGPAPADRLRVPLDKPSAFRQVIEKAGIYYGESSDETLRAFFREIGLPSSPAILLLPLISDQKVVAVIYGDFGRRAASPVRLDMLEILALQAGIVLEYSVFRRQVARAGQKQ